jgi:hypothetical protein
MVIAKRISGKIVEYLLSTVRPREYNREYGGGKENSS